MSVTSYFGRTMLSNLIITKKRKNGMLVTTSETLITLYVEIKRECIE